ncbi:hypothetical protein POM88_046362 [Heracleum sosnowskyi]|uniref:Uncharacterized protein n=1 Tax=Heracleum sosnowskyi TaxID=360622 RepID=A0AAD8H950_9APIA|nr:hypothetical protein POM88_046362 [Heracleum sosnowskyi]
MDSEEEAAALVLCSMKNSKVDYETSLQLEKTRRLFVLNKHKFQHPSLSNNHSRLLSLVPPSLAQVIGTCSTPFEKRLTGSDIQLNQVRLLLNYRHVMKFLHPLLRPSEVDKIKKKGMVVCVYDCYGRMYEMVFTLWGTKAYVITTRNWFEFCVDHGFKKDLDWVTIWMFRHNVSGRICFVITSERRFLGKAVEPVFDLPLAARKKRSKSCSSRINLKRRRLNDDDGVIRFNWLISARELQARSVSTDGLRPSFLKKSGVVYYIQVLTKLKLNRTLNVVVATKAPTWICYSEEIWWGHSLQIKLTLGYESLRYVNKKLKETLISLG